LSHPTRSPQRHPHPFSRKNYNQQRSYVSSPPREKAEKWSLYPASLACWKQVHSTPSSLVMHPATYAQFTPAARDLTLEAARDASYIRKTSTRVLPAAQLKKLLDSRSDRDVLEGLRKVITVRPPLRYPA